MLDGHSRIECVKRRYIIMAIQNLSSYHSATVFLPLVTTLLGVIGAGISWTKDLNKTSRRLRLLDEQSKRVQFWSAWLQALDLTQPNHAEDVAAARVEVRKAGQTISTVFTDPGVVGNWTLSSFVAYRKNLSLWRRIFLIYHQPNFMAQLFRVGAYVCLLLMWFSDSVTKHVLRLDAYSAQSASLVRGLVSHLSFPDSYHHQYIVFAAMKGWGVLCFIIYRYISVGYETNSLSR